MGEQSATDGRGRYGVPTCVGGRDQVDELLVEWEQQRPDLDFTPVGVITRLARIRGYLDAELSSVFRDFGLTQADFVVIVTLRRSGPPFTMPQARLMDALGLTSGTVSVRLDRLERSGIVTRESDPALGRRSLVHLTDKGLQLFDDIAPVHLRNEDRLLSALSGDQRRQLADLLRRLLASFEGGTTDVAGDLGLMLEPAHVARTRRQAVGLSDTPGMLVAHITPGSPADLADVQRGDLITAIDGIPAVSSVSVAEFLADAPHPAAMTLSMLRGNAEMTAELQFSRPDPAGPGTVDSGIGPQPEVQTASRRVH